MQHSADEPAPGTNPETALEQLRRENETLRAELDAAEQTLQSIKSGSIDALLVAGPAGERLLALQDVDHPYRQLIENLSEGVLTLTMDGVVLYANHRFADMLKTSLELVIGSLFGSWTASDGLGTLEHLLRPHAGTQREQITLTARDGSRLPVVVSVTELRVDRSGGMLGMVVIDLRAHEHGGAPFADERLARMALLSVIEDQHRAEATLRESERRFRTIFEQVPVGVAVVDSDSGKIYEANEKFRRITGRTREQLSALGWQRITHLEDIAAGEEAMARLRDGEAAVSQCKRYVRPDGSEVTVHLTIAPLIHEAGESPRHLGMIEDITEAERTRRALAESESLFRGIVEQSIAGVYIVQDNEFKYANPRLAEILRYDTPEELVGRPVLSVIAEPDHPRVETNMQRRLSGEQPRISYTLRGLRKDGTTVHVALHGSRIMYCGAPAVVGLVLDLSETMDAGARSWGQGE
ncbi:MAG: PAS domain S-box protein [Gammaproteobacteria bacterium]